MIDTTAPIPLTTSPQPNLASIAAQARSGDERSLREAAESFESIFMTMILKEMREASSPDGFFEGDRSGVYGSLFDLYMGRHLAQGNSFGIAEMLIRQLQPAASTESS